MEYSSLSISGLCRSDTDSSTGQISGSTRDGADRATVFFTPTRPNRSKTRNSERVSASLPQRGGRKSQTACASLFPLTGKRAVERVSSPVSRSRQRTTACTRRQLNTPLLRTVTVTGSSSPLRQEIPADSSAVSFLRSINAMMISITAQTTVPMRMHAAMLPLPCAHVASHSSSHSAKMIRFFAIAQIWSGRATCCSTSASTSLAVVSAILALGDRMRRWAHTSAKI